MKWAGLHWSLAALLVAAFAGAGLLLWSSSGPFQPASRPNVSLIVADDMRADGLWAMPSVLELAQRGVSFHRYFVTTPLCCPSRASIMTGLYARHHGVLANEPEQQGGF